jgi:AraC-like DNA-binding protein/mannose-6-phosphate isomerase-like protein (cupin superfamily)
MDYSYLDKEEYRDILLYKILDNKNGLPFFVIKLDCSTQSKHRHEYVQIIYVCKGRLKHVLGNNCFDVYKGDIFVIPPFVPHYFIDTYKEKYEIIELEFIPEFINEKFSINSKDRSFTDFAYLEPFLVSENEVRPRLNLSGSLQNEVESILSEILREYDNREPDFELVIKALILKLLVLVGRKFKKDIVGSESQGVFDRHRDALFSALKYINENFINDINVEEAAKVAMVSQSYFRYLFKQMTQKTFNEYVNDLRISKAVELLKSRPDMKVIDICCESGFNNVNHFNRIFRQKTGVSPMVFKKTGI